MFDLFMAWESGAEGAKSAPTVTPAIKPTTVTVHRGLEGVYIERSTITNIDGERGVLEHRGYNIHDLVNTLANLRGFNACGNGMNTSQRSELGKNLG
ncbi:hypothetical protein [Nostoc sp.]|uniref:hypothetical protein n=1 Tax=Nostoc sp. TaxID=1180 RepID=UPI002FF7A1F9